MNKEKLDRALEHLNAALLLLSEGESAPRAKRPEWFRENGRLSDQGIDHMVSLFVKGKTSYSIAKEMHLSYRAVSLRHDEWRKKNPNAAAWMRQDGK